MTDLLPTLAQLESTAAVVYQGLAPTPQYAWPLLASYSMELLRAVADLDVVYVPIGLGSGICGMIAAREALRRKTEVVGVVSARAPAYALSFAQRRPVDHPVTTRIADGMACRAPEPEALEVLWRHMARVVQVSDDEVESAMRLMFSATHNTAEGAGAAGLAAALQERGRLAGKKVAMVISGANVDRDVFAEILGARPEARGPRD